MIQIIINCEDKIQAYEIDTFVRTKKLGKIEIKDGKEAIDFVSSKSVERLLPNEKEKLVKQIIDKHI